LTAILQELIFSLCSDFDLRFRFLGRRVVLSIVVILKELYLEVDVLL